MDSSSSKRRRVTASRSIATGTSSSANVSDNDEDNESPRRASYMAPTRASINKYNPNILSGQSSIATGDVQRVSATASLRGPARGLNPTALRPKMTAPRLSASPTRETSSSPSRRARSSHGSLAARGKMIVPTPRQSTEANQLEDEEAAESQVHAEEERSLLEEEKLAESVQRRINRSRMGQSGLIASIAKDQADPELPPTPAQLGLEEIPRPPPGVLSSSPRNTVSARKARLKSSPLKPLPTQEGKIPSSEAQQSETPNRSGLDLSHQNAEATAEEEESQEDDPEVLERRRKFDQLSKQLQQLRSDVSFLQSQARRAQDRPNQAIPRGNLERIVNILTTSSAPDKIESSPLKPTSLATRLSAFLPFAKKTKSEPEHALLKEEILPSYKPVEGPNPLVHLQAFTKMSVSSVQRLALIEAEGFLLNQQQLTVSAPAPLDLDVDLVLFSDTDTDSVEQVSLESITPWADSELGTWIRQQAEDTADIAVIGWGSSRYLDVARTRAHCWSKCSRVYPQYTSPTSTPPSFPSSSTADDEIQEEQLAPILGKVSLRLESKTTKAALQITWRIDLDWIGDAESHISASATVPPKWIEKDIQRGSLGKIPETFEMLVRKVGVFEAIKVMVDLVLGIG